DRTLSRSAWLGHAYALAAVMGGWVLFRCETLAQALDCYRALAGSTNADPARHPVAQYLDHLVMTTLVIGTVFATPLAQRIGRRRDRVASEGARGRWILAADVAWLTVVMIA